MNEANKSVRILDEVLVEKIFQIRGKNVMLDSDLANLYGVETKRLKERVRRNIERFPIDFMLELTEKEHIQLKTEFGKLGRGSHSKYAPFAFTEHGVLMLSTVLNSERAIKVNIQIMRVYIRIREMLSTSQDLLLKMEQIEKKVYKQDKQIDLVFNYLKQFIKSQEKPKKEVGFKRNDEP